MNFLAAAVQTRPKAYASQPLEAESNEVAIERALKWARGMRLDRDTLKVWRISPSQKLIHKGRAAR